MLYSTGWLLYPHNWLEYGAVECGETQQFVFNFKSTFTYYEVNGFPIEYFTALTSRFFTTLDSVFLQYSVIIETLLKPDNFDPFWLGFYKVKVV